MDYEKGGLKMIDLKSFITSLKYAGSKEWLNLKMIDYFKKKLYLNELEQLGGKFECNYSENEICKFTQNVFFFKKNIA